MGFNIHLYCVTCNKHLHVDRGAEAAAIKRFEKEHPNASHVKEVGIDNGFAEKDWMEDA